MGEVTPAPAGVTSGPGATGQPDYAEFSCRMPPFGARRLDGLSDTGAGFDPDP